MNYTFGLAWVCMWPSIFGHPGSRDVRENTAGTHVESLTSCQANGRAKAEEMAIRRNTAKLGMLESLIAWKDI